MNEWKTTLKLWEDNIDKDSLLELKKLEQKEQKERFNEDLNFGTAGIRALMGIGTNRINKYTINRFIKAYGLFLKENFSSLELKEKGVLIFHDNRKDGKIFSEYAASALLSLGIKVTFSYLNQLQPTPLLSYMVRNKDYIGGLNITASHNFKEFNGIKFYTSKGSQIDLNDSKEIKHHFDQLGYFDTEVKINLKTVKYLSKNFENDYLEEVIFPMIKKTKFHEKILFSPQHGTSLGMVKKITKEMNIDLSLVKSQSFPSETFENTLNPNPGTIEAFNEAVPIAINQDISTIISIDPDGDRLGLMIKDDNNWIHLNGNELAILMLFYLIKTTRASKLKNSFIVKSIVTSDQGTRIANFHNIKVYETLTGFKHLANKSLEIQEDEVRQGIKPKKISNSLLIYEESYGSIINNMVADKDAFQAFVLVVQMLNYFKSKYSKISEVLNTINQKYGHTKSIQFTKEISSITESEEYLLNITKSIGHKLEDVKHVTLDYIEDLEKPRIKTQLPTKGIKIWLKGGSWVAIRPSGTEPIIKFYLDLFNLDNETENKLKDVFESFF